MTGASVRARLTMWIVVWVHVASVIKWKRRFSGFLVWFGFALGYGRVSLI